ncbi:MAG: PD40 domain-containing protein [Planctomycetes bacterium]|nr:PD40 domain-containing protein [Planctomycetota bacterium]
MKTELENGVIIHQVTDEERLVSNIYCERPFCTPDSKRFLYARQLDGGGPDNPNHWEYVLCEFGSWKEEVVGEGFFHVSTSYNDDFFYQRAQANGNLEFVRLDLATGTSKVVWTCPPDMTYADHPAVSPDGRLLAFGMPVSFDPQLFSVVVVNLETGEQNTVFTHQHICNTHLQFHATDNRTLLVQVNRGCEYSKAGEKLKQVGEEGTTLLLLDILTGKTETLAAGQPATQNVSGHQTWLGTSDEVIFTVWSYPPYDASPGKGNILTVQKGKGGYRQFAGGTVINHIGSTPCGRYFFGDNEEGDHLVIGSPTTGKTVCVHKDPEQGGDSPFGQQSHPHVYLTKDFKWMVYNSDRTGRPQIYAAQIPPELLRELDES